jgi:hypothetical protein
MDIVQNSNFNCALFPILQYNWQVTEYIFSYNLVAMEYFSACNLSLHNYFHF